MDTDEFLTVGEESEACRLCSSESANLSCATLQLGYISFILNEEILFLSHEFQNTFVLRKDFQSFPSRSDTITTYHCTDVSN